MFRNYSRKLLLVAAFLPAFAACAGTDCLTCPTPAPVEQPPVAPVTPMAVTLASVTVQGPQTVTAGQTFSVSLQGTYSDGSKNIIGSAATWSSSNAAVLSVAAGGAGSANAAGNGVVTGSFQGKTASITIVVSAAQPVGGGFPDPLTSDASGTQQYGMHVCPVGTALVEVSGGKGHYNQFYCRRVTSNFSSVIDIESRAQRQVQSSHVCPAGYYLRGMNIAENRFTCSTHPGITIATRDSDITATRGSYTLTCAPGQVAVGFNENEQKILCTPMSGI